MKSCTSISLEAARRECAEALGCARRALGRLAHASEEAGMRDVLAGTIADFTTASGCLMAADDSLAATLNLRRCENPARLEAFFPPMRIAAVPDASNPSPEEVRA